MTTKSAWYERRAHLSKVEAAAEQIQAAARVLGVTETFELDFEDETNDIEVVGHEWQTLPPGQLSHGPESIAYYLRNTKRWTQEEADRSGIYLKHAGVRVRFC